MRHAVRQIKEVLKDQGLSYQERVVVTTLVLEHYFGDSYQSVLGAEQSSSVEALKAMGIETLTLYRGVGLDVGESEDLFQMEGQPPGRAVYGTGPRSPLTAWSLDRDEAKWFADVVDRHDEEKDGWIIKAEVPVDAIVGLSFHGFGVLDEGEVVVGPTARDWPVQVAGTDARI